MTNHQDIIQRYKDGEAITQIATFYGVSKQRIQQIVSKRGEHRPTVNELRQASDFAFFDSYRDSILELRGTRMTWTEVRDTLSIEWEGTPNADAFKRWRKARGVNTQSGLGPFVYCSRLGRCVHQDGPLQPRSNFHAHHKGPGGLCSVCKDCQRDYQQRHMGDFVRRNKTYRDRKDSV